MALLSLPTRVQSRGRSAKPGLGREDRSHKFLAVLLGTWRTPQRLLLWVKVRRLWSQKER